MLNRAWYTFPQAAPTKDKKPHEKKRLRLENKKKKKEKRPVLDVCGKLLVGQA